MQKIGWTSHVKNKEVYTESGKKEKSNLQKNEGTLSGLVTCGIATALQNT